jgi:hypothetical protein
LGGLPLRGINLISEAEYPSRLAMKRPLGRSGFEVSALGMGCWAIGDPFRSGENPFGWEDMNDEESVHAIHKANDPGVNLLKTFPIPGSARIPR